MGGKLEQKRSRELLDILHPSAPGIRIPPKLSPKEGSGSVYSLGSPLSNQEAHVYQLGMVGSQAPSAAQRQQRYRAEHRHLLRYTEGLLQSLEKPHATQYKRQKCLRPGDMDAMEGGVVRGSPGGPRISEFPGRQNGQQRKEADRLGRSTKRASVNRQKTTHLVAHAGGSQLMPEARSGTSGIGTDESFEGS